MKQGEPAGYAMWIVRQPEDPTMARYRVLSDFERRHHRKDKLFMFLMSFRLFDRWWFRIRAPRIAKIYGLTERYKAMERKIFSLTRTEKVANEGIWELKEMFVTYEHQRRGVGAALLKDFLQRVDADGVVAYAPALTHEERFFYSRFGFGKVAAGPR